MRAIMDDTALRDVERSARTAQWNDKIEIRLDNRQVFFLFFGSAVVACMLFVLGVIVGKRIESRGRAAAPDIQDPLAVLDRVSQHPATAGAPALPAPTVELTFPKTLLAPAAAPAPAPLKPKAFPPTAARPPVAKLVVTPAPKPVIASKAPALPADLAKAPKGKFTLHLATLQTKDEADALAKKYPGAFVISGDVPGKGVVFRVRCGNFASYQEATAAKVSFEKQNKAIALIAAR